MASLGRILLVGGGMEYIRLFLMMGYEGATSINEADAICFTGGEDVDPSLYGEKALRSTYSNIDRDKLETQIFRAGQKLGLPMVGICRGGQFLNVMCGGSLYQDVDGHRGSHIAYENLPKGSNKKKKYPEGLMVTSTHHQMMIPTKAGKVLLVADESTNRHQFGRSVTGPAKMQDVEAVWYQEERCLCFQPHPEIPQASKECVSLFSHFMDEYVLPELPLPEAILKVVNTPEKKGK